MMKIMVVGPVGAGKTSLIHALQKVDAAVRKTQTICFLGSAIDTPGEYAQIPRFYSALLVTSMEASLILVIKDASDPILTMPPGFARMFARPVVGVVTKTDLPQADCRKAAEHLRQTGAGPPVFMVSALTGEGIEELHGFLVERGCYL
ncbi:MAG: EutP/PduV family microcompartment system protein [Negativicutes bacterium]|nr:EutP/PduV family microcompartment system protein [Negativicutes bacterium]